MRVAEIFARQRGGEAFASLHRILSSRGIRRLTIATLDSTESSPVRFEYHAEYAGTPYAILLSLLGRDVTAGRTFETVAPFDSTPDRRYVPATGHSLRSGAGWSC